MAADCQRPSGLGPDHLFLLHGRCRMLGRGGPRRSAHPVRPTRCTRDLLSLCGTPGHERGPRPNFRRDSDTYRRLRETHGEIALADETGLAERARLRARGQGPSRLQPLLRLGGAPAAPVLSSAWRRIRLQLSEAPPGRLCPFRKHHEIVEILTCYGDHFDVMTGATGISWRREGPGTGARTPLIYLLMAVSARRLSPRWARSMCIGGASQNGCEACVSNHRRAARR